MVLENGIALAKSAYTNMRDAKKINCISNVRFLNTLF